MSKELIERLREAAAQRVASTAMIGADDLSAAADALESLGAAYGGAVEAGRALAKQAFKAEQERDALAAELKALREQAPVAVYKGHRHIPSDTKEFWGMADNHLPAGTHLYAHHVPACELSDETIQRHWDEACKDTPQTPGWSRHIRFARAIERYLNGEGE